MSPGLLQRLQHETFFCRMKKREEKDLQSETET